MKVSRRLRHLVFRISLSTLKLADIWFHASPFFSLYLNFGCAVSYSTGYCLTNSINVAVRSASISILLSQSIDSISSSRGSVLITSISILV
uniref:Putative secreted protein n=1 Tax=Anopheles marajoara TaxID=58244 RepID=A0A2M4C9X8_9DIPT